jgi:hypothetical protein
MQNKSVLNSGIGVAGPTLVERAPRLRTGDMSSTFGGEATTLRSGWSFSLISSRKEVMSRSFVSSMIKAGAYEASVSTSSARSRTAVT